MRVIEQKILALLEQGKVGDYWLTDHDHVTIKDDGSKSYRLWGTELYHKDSNGEEYFFFSSRAADTFDCMSATTASRIKALMYHTPCSVYRKAGKLYEWYTGSQVFTDITYKIVDGRLVQLYHLQHGEVSK